MGSSPSICGQCVPAHCVGASGPCCNAQVYRHVGREGEGEGEEGEGEEEGKEEEEEE